MKSTTAATQKTKRKTQVFASIVYSLFQITIGLLLHPYQTMQSLVRDKIFVWMTLLPTVCLALITVLWKLVLVPVVSVFFTCKTNIWGGCSFLPFVSNTITFFFLYWQVVLLYLLFRFGGVRE